MRQTLNDDVTNRTSGVTKHQVTSALFAARKAVRSHVSALALMLVAFGALPQHATAQVAADPAMPSTTARQGQPAANEAATLVADRVQISGKQTLIAEGSVEVYYQGNRLTATRILYDDAAQEMTITGPIRMVDASGNTLIFAQSAELDRDLRNGIMNGARLVLARELQLAANRIARQEGRYTVLDSVVASSCQICATDPTPLWEIRARRVTHDSLTRQLYFENAQFRAMGVPLAWLPALRVPDPTVERMTGILAPTITTSSLLGVGVSVPYFITLGDSRDLTLTPAVTSQDSYTLGLRYREAYRNGRLDWEGALTRDRVLPDDKRGYLFADGSFDLPRGYRLGVQLRMVTDDAYLVDYDITDEERLWTGLTLERVRADRLVWGRIGNTYSIRDGENNGTQPALAADVQLSRQYLMGGGIAHLDWNVHAHRRASDLDGDLGRDMARAGVEAGFSRNWVAPNGMLLNATGLLNADIYRINSDSRYENTIGRIAPSAALTLRWPFVRQTGSAAEVLEPVAQIVWSRRDLPKIPNEDSILVEFDEGNLFSLSRYPGEDARERGLRANLGLSWTRQDAAGWSLGLTAGRVFKAEDLAQFGSSTGLTGTSSDWLIAAHLTMNNGLIVSNRALIDDDFSLSRDELRIGYLNNRTSLSMGYLWMQADPVELRFDPVSELLLDTSFPLSGNWNGSLDTRYDLTADRAAKAALGLEYVNECISVDLSLARRFTSSTSLTPETRFGVSVELAGFGAGAKGQSATCTR